MCGICGSAGRADLDAVKRACSVMRHRGPDDEGYYSDSFAALGNRRLSIIDLETGRQPISNEDGSIWITYNGEVYNYKELRKMLEKEHRFRTNTDTEVILHWYERDRRAFPSGLNGIFSIAIWDSNEKTLVLARDPVGVKPLHYSLRDDGTLLFASEPKGVLQFPEMEVTVDPVAAISLLSLGYVPGERTLFGGIRKLRPGHRLIWRGGKVIDEKYWSLPSETTPSSLEGAVQTVSRLLPQVVSRQMVSDVPLGSFLSGGLDTSVIVALAVRLKPDGFKTFTMGFGEETDELRDARTVSELLGTDHHEEILRQAELVDELPRMIWHADTPKINLHPYFVSRMASRTVKVCFSGLGGDELFGGYTTRLRHYRRFRIISTEPLRTISRMMGRMVAGLSGSSHGILGRLSALRFAGDRRRAYLRVHGLLDPVVSRSIYGPRLTAIGDGGILEEYGAHFPTGQGDMVDEAMRAEFSTKLVDDFLSVEDTMSMANSLEVRVPLLDLEMVNAAFRMPISLRSDPDHGKRVLRAAASQLLPPGVLSKAKWGFSPSYLTWARGEVGQVLSNLLEKPAPGMSSLVDPTFMMKITSGRIEREFEAKMLFRIGLMNLWHRIYLGERGITEPPDWRRLG